MVSMSIGIEIKANAACRISKIKPITLNVYEYGRGDLALTCFIIKLTALRTF